ncbi:MAG TPA: orotate phosphoribosyltransferase [Bdellovibrionales bacterium]|nr:orotate phosphoribosyltransferase [Pseudobdellovibrionaceae bacterium]HAG92174.1 orotate phosphoribosyltransferase [Bdellovibrionales bacterium]|tara:strand:+ start:20374 stop:20820 length:447 start_codon:yes stop_codon:yes gene_type:complete
MKSLLIASVILLSGSAFAQKIGPAGCGLGNMVLGGEENQVLAATTNGTFYSQIFGITSGTSNCMSDDGMAKLETFIDGNRVALETEAARGQGETLESVAQILKCPSTLKVSETLKASHSEIFNGTSTEISSNVMNALKANAVLCLNNG